MFRKESSVHILTAHLLCCLFVNKSMAHIEINTCTGTTASDARMTIYCQQTASELSGCLAGKRFRE